MKKTMIFLSKLTKFLQLELRFLVSLGQRYTEYYCPCTQVVRFRSSSTQVFSVSGVKNSAKQPRQLLYHPQYFDCSQFPCIFA